MGACQWQQTAAAAAIALLIAVAAATAAPLTSSAQEPDASPISISSSSGSQRHHQHHHRRRLARCRGTLGRWCRAFLEQPLLPALPPPAWGRACPGNCSGVGVCNAMTGLCDCPAGWTGPDCSNPQKRPCSAGGHSYRGPGSEPSVGRSRMLRAAPAGQQIWTAAAAAATHTLWGVYPTHPTHARPHAHAEPHWA